MKNTENKVNLLIKILEDKELFNKVLVFSPSKRYADKIHELIDPFYGSETCVIHSNKAQNYRLRSIEQFERGENRILIATDVIARGLDLTGISHVINIDVPIFPENYMHRIGRTGRAKVQGEAILFYTKDEIEAKSRIEELMKYKIPEMEFPKDVELSKELMYEEMPKDDLVILGADLKPETVIDSYQHGIFPMHIEVANKRQIGWWSPQQRGILPLNKINISKSLQKSMQKIVAVEQEITLQLIYYTKL